MIVVGVYAFYVRAMDWMLTEGKSGDELGARVGPYVHKYLA